MKICNAYVKERYDYLRSGYSLVTTYRDVHQGFSLQTLEVTTFLVFALFSDLIINRGNIDEEDLAKW